MKLWLRVFRHTELPTLFVAVLLASPSARAQIPGLPIPITPTTEHKEPSRKGVAAATGPITVKESVSDQTITRFLAKFLPKYPGVREVKVAVDDGVVSLSGRIADDGTRDELTDVVRRVQGVRVVLNQMKTDDDVMTAWQMATRETDALMQFFSQKWLLIVAAFAIIATFIGAARLFGSHSETILAPFVGNALLRSVVGSLISTFLVLAGTMLALATLRLTQAVLSILGLSAVVGLAVGFAFRDITENFIASVLLGIRRPFQIGDYVTVAGQSGVVKSLNTRATVLVTLEGNHVRIPNSVIFKEIMVNATASPTFRNGFDVKIPYAASTAGAIQAISASLGELSGILPDPPPRALVDALEADGVRLKVYFWSPSQGVDWIQLMSDAKLKTKVALQAAGMIAAQPAQQVPAASDTPQSRAAEPPRISPEKIRANLERDKHAALSLAGASDTTRQDPIDRAVEQPETRVSSEGANLLTEQNRAS
jgi:small-conductance mechanosensitive channel